MYVIDASVFVADARPSEPFHPEARAFLLHLARGDGTICLPAIALAEVAAAITRGAGNPALALQLVSIIRRRSHLEIIAVDAVLGQQAANLAGQYGLRGCDAVYAAVAARQGAVLVTLDQQQRTRLPAAIAARTPAEELAVLGYSRDVGGDWVPADDRGPAVQP